jgi:dienelactone hydrolase
MRRRRSLTRGHTLNPLPKSFETEPLAQLQLASTARIEIHHFTTMTVTDKQFLTGAKDGIPVRIGGELRLPSGTGRVPVVTLIHGSAGVGANVDRWAKELNGIGVAAFLLDCFTGRNIVQTVTDQSQLGHLAMIVDAYRASELLSKHARIDASRIAIMGFSKGGFVALYSSLKRFRQLHGPVNIEFAAYIAFYPPCNTIYVDDEEVGDRPIRLFHGTGDDYVSIEPCRQYVERLRRRGKDVQLTEYQGAQHVFDNPMYSPAFVLPDAVTTNRCLLEERREGQIVNVATNQPFSQCDACVSRGATLGYDATATGEATRAVKAFVAATFKLGT